MLENYLESITYKRFIETFGENSAETKLYQYILQTFPENGLIRIDKETNNIEYQEDVFIILSSLAILFGSNKRVISDLEKAYDLGAILKDNSEHGDNLLLLLADALNFNYTSSTTKEGIIKELKDKRIFLKHYQQIIRNKGTIRALETILNLFSAYTDDTAYSFKIEEDFEGKRVNINIIGDRNDFLGDEVVYIELEQEGETQLVPQINQNHFLYKIISDIKPAGLTYNILINIMVEIIIGQNIVLFDKDTEQAYFETVKITYKTPKGDFNGKDTYEYIEKGQEIIVPEIIPNEPSGWFFNGWDKGLAKTTTVNLEYTANWRRQKEAVIEFYKDDETTLLKTESIKANRQDYITVNMNMFPTPPEKPNQDGKKYTFIGWKVIQGLTAEYLTPATYSIAEEGGDTISIIVVAEYSTEQLVLTTPIITDSYLNNTSPNPTRLYPIIWLTNSNDVEVTYKIFNYRGSLINQGPIKPQTSNVVYDKIPSNGLLRPQETYEIIFEADGYRQSPTIYLRPQNWRFEGVPVFVELEAEGIDVKMSTLPTKIRNIDSTIKGITYYTMRGTKDYMKDFGQDYDYLLETPATRYRLTPFTDGSSSSTWSFGPTHRTVDNLSLSGRNLEIRNKQTPWEINNNQLGKLITSRPLSTNDINFKTNLGTRLINSQAGLSAIYNAKQRLYEITIRPTVKSLVYGIVEYKSTAFINPHKGEYKFSKVISGSDKITINMNPIKESNMPSKVDISMVVIPVDPNVKNYGYFEQFTITATKVG